VLNGGLPEWKKKGMPVEKNKIYKGEPGDFTAEYIPDLMSDYKDVLHSIKIESTLVIDARSENRFNGTEPEPRVGLRRGHIPNSTNLPYIELIKNGKMISKEKLLKNFSKFDPVQDRLVFTCGSGITACILALGADIAGMQNNTVYDGSWTEWGSLTELPIE
jgi:thiosulfate/3-mercaptopyruvate sulfurtransferase